MVLKNPKRLFKIKSKLNALALLRKNDYNYNLLQ